MKAFSKQMHFSRVKKAVLKIGTSCITEDLKLDDKKVKQVVAHVGYLKSKKVDVILVSSGAIAAGIRKLELKERPRDINMLQACAAVGQNELMKAYGRQFNRLGYDVGQILLTREDLNSRKRYLNFKNTITALLKNNITPVINENDTLGVDEIRFGDNDTLAAQVAANTEADLLILMSSMDGLYTRDPKRDKNAKRIPVVRKVDKEIQNIRGRSSKGGVGGIESKIEAAKISTDSGIPVALVDHRMKDVIRRLFMNEPVGTVFLPGKKLDNKLHWILYTGKPKGEVVVDDGAVKALSKGTKSLLPVGILGSKGAFKKGDPVVVVGEDGAAIGKGIVNFSSLEITKIRGMQSKDVEKVTHSKVKEIIYKHDMIIFRKR